MDELELELQTSASESQKFEELHKESGLHAESETNRALEFKRLLELVESSPKEMEDQMACVQLELKKLLGNEVSAREELEQQLKSQESKITSVQEELAKVLEEKEALEVAVTDLTNNATQMKELCNDLGCSRSNLRLLFRVLGRCWAFSAVTAMEENERYEK
ncbi:myosin-11-like [Forsythia ovata]|uniref:Myosin-11-like n=1 Tax=Forsythia ovata TaxID=205694 RepID=A0ABD1UVJ3_9LAMI